MAESDTSVVATRALPVAMLARVRAFVKKHVYKAAVPDSSARGWPHTMGTVLSATVQVARRGTTRQEAPLVLYAYQVDGQLFQGSRVRASADRGRPRLTDADSSASSTVAQYPSGAPVVVYYDPSNPANSALER